MTPLDLLDELKAYIERKTKDMILPVRVDRKSGEHKERPAEVHIGSLPDKESETKRIPYVLLQFIKSTDSQEEGERAKSVCMVRIIATTYSEDREDGRRCLLNLLTRIKTEFLRDGMVADRYILKSPLEMMVYTEDTAPYYLGEMITHWSLPEVESEVNFIWQQ